MKTIKITLTLIILTGVIFSCKEEETAPKFDNESYEEVIDAGGVPEEVAEEETVTDSTVTDQTRPDGTTWVCTTKTYSVVDGNPEFPLFNPNASVIYPGSLLQGETLVNATPSVIPVERAGGSISIDVQDGNVQPSFEVEEVTKSNIAEAANSIISGSTGVVPANFNFTAEEVQSKEQLALSLGVNFENQFAKVESNFSFREDKEYSRFMVKLNQSFYTLSFDIPSSTKGFFAPEVTPEDLSQYVGSGNPATFISDVTYGRVYYMLIESSSSSRAIEASINASFSSGSASGGVDVDASHLSELSELQIKVVALGGESQSTFATIGETNIATLVDLLGTSTDIRTGVPISYVVRSVKNKEIVNVKLATEYDVTKCVPLSTPLGDPIVWWDASTLDLTNADENTCTDCLVEGTKYKYYAENDSYRHDIFSPKGTGVKKWPDNSGNEIDANAIAGDPDSRPIFVTDAFDNGMPAVEFFRGADFGEYVNKRLSYSGGIFTNTNYTIFMVISYPKKLKLERKALSSQWVMTIKQNDYGYIMRGSSDEPLNNLTVGFKNNSLFSFSHRQTELNTDQPEFTPSPEFKVIAVTFSKTDGMAIYENGKLIAEDPGQNQALESNPGAMLCAPYTGSAAGYSRVRIGEIRCYGVAASEAQIKQETTVLSKRYGL